MNFTISTWADTRSNRRDRTYTVEADHANDACDEAVARAEHDIRHHRSIYTTIVDVDGNGPPVDCAHLATGYPPRRRRPNGGWDCEACWPTTD